MNYELCIMNYLVPTRVRPTDVFPNNYALRIMNYEFKGSPYRCISQQL